MTPRPCTSVPGMVLRAENNRTPPNNQSATYDLFHGIVCFSIPSHPLGDLYGAPKVSSSGPPRTANKKNVYPAVARWITFCCLSQLYKLSSHTVCRCISNISTASVSRNGKGTLFGRYTLNQPKPRLRTYICGSCLSTLRRLLFRQFF